MDCYHIPYWVDLQLFNVPNNASTSYPDQSALLSDDTTVAEESEEPNEAYHAAYIRTPLKEGEHNDVIIANSYGGPPNTKRRMFVLPRIWVDLNFRITKDMSEFFQENPPEKPSQFVSGRHYAVRLHGYWNRVRLLHTTNGNRVKIYFYDEGISRNVERDKINVLPEQFLTVGPMVIEVKCRNFCPPLMMGDKVMLKFCKMLQPEYWLVELPVGPWRMGRIKNSMEEYWQLNGGAPCPLTDFGNLIVATEGYELSFSGDFFPVKILRHTKMHIIATPIAWLNEINNFATNLHVIALISRPLPYGLVALGACCAVPHRNEWFRARIRSANREKNIILLKVRFIDTGYVKCLDLSDARVLPPQLLPRYKRPLCFAIKKTEGLIKALPVGEFRSVKLTGKNQDDNSWIAMGRSEASSDH